MIMTAKMNAVSTPGYTITLKILFVIMMFFKDASRVTCRRIQRTQEYTDQHRTLRLSMKKLPASYIRGDDTDASS